jgi:Pvc16 N-terminal domain
MALLNISLVTRTLVNLLMERVPQYPDFPGGTTLSVSPAPPDLVTGTHAISLYLYHAREDAHTKAQNWGVDDAYPLRYKPMGVTLNYMLCPRSNTADVADRTWTDQLLMGLAMKTLHDYPYIDDTTTVATAGPPVLVMHAGMRGRSNRLRILLRPTPPEEASQYWQAGSQAMRLAAYYEVSATLLEPEEPKRRAGRVFAYGVHTFVRGNPFIECTRNSIQFTIPGESVPRGIDSSPAEVGFAQPFEVVGADLKGDQTALFLNHRDFVEPVEVDAAWNITTDGSVLKAVARPAAGAQAVVPGIYGVRVRTIARRTLPDGSQRDFDFWSNEAPLVIAPVIVAVAFAAGLGAITVSGFDPVPLLNNDLIVFAGDARLDRVTAAPTAGQYRTVAPDRIEFRMPAGTAPGALMPMRIIVRGAESAPRWEIAP